MKPWPVRNIDWYSYILYLYKRDLVLKAFLSSFVTNSSGFCSQNFCGLCYKNYNWNGIMRNATCNHIFKLLIVLHRILLHIPVYMLCVACLFVFKAKLWSLFYLMNRWIMVCLELFHHDRSSAELPLTF